MRIMQIPPFSKAIKITDLGTVIRTRLTHEIVLWPDQAIPLVGYMAWPNDLLARNNWLEVARTWFDGSDTSVPPKLKLIQQHWARVADIVHLHWDLFHGGHQRRRGGASVAKAIAIIAANAKSKGTRQAKLWQIWTEFKDVAHLVAAAILISGEALRRHQIAPYGLRRHQLQPYRMAMLLPDLVLSVAMSLESYGLQRLSHGRREPMLEPQSLWRISPDINLTALEPPIRKVAANDLAVLKTRRSGNRGKAKRRNPRKTTPVLA
jgi:hypothetical protein